MKKVVAYLVFALFSITMFSGCAVVPSPLPGLLYTEIKAPIGHLQAPLDATSHSKVGTATAKTYLGAIATGDASIEAAMKNGGIRKIHHVDFQSKSIFIFYGEFTTTVYGE